MDIDKKRAKEKQKANKQLERDKKNEARLKQDAENLEMAGREVAQLAFGFGMMTVYENCFVVFAPYLGSPVFEKLLSYNIYDGNVAKKTGVGRGIAAVLTAGISLATTPSMRGEVIITVFTDKKTHTSKVLPTSGTLKHTQQIRAALDAVLNSSSANLAGNEKTETDLGASIEKLVALRDSGALSAEEFEKAKAKLLD